MGKNCNWLSRRGIKQRTRICMKNEPQIICPSVCSNNLPQKLAPILSLSHTDRCIDNMLEKFYWYTQVIGKKKITRTKNCQWLSRRNYLQMGSICRNNFTSGLYRLARRVCPLTCGSCDP